MTSDAGVPAPASPGAGDGAVPAAQADPGTLAVATTASTAALAIHPVMVIWTPLLLRLGPRPVLLAILAMVTDQCDIVMKLTQF
jgi:hypothetical protein